MPHGRGMLLGKFLPPHLGHQYLVDFARHHCQDLTVLVCSIEAEPIPGALRYGWMRAMFPDIRIVHHTDELPQAPAGPDDEAFWAVWQRSIRRFCPALDFVYASEPYGARLAAELDAEFVPVDLAREAVPISGSAIRARPMRHWSYIPDVVRPHFVRRVVLHGPESSGKSTLAARLARHFGTVAMPEYARGYLDLAGGTCTAPGQIDRIARGQTAGEEALARQAMRLLFVDTDALTTKVWSRYLFGSTPAWLDDMIAGQRRHLDILLEPAPWVDDGTRVQRDEAERHGFAERLAVELSARGRPFIRIGGDWEARFAACRAAVEPLLDDADG